MWWCEQYHSPAVGQEWNWITTRYHFFGDSDELVAFILGENIVEGPTTVQSWDDFFLHIDRKCLELERLAKWERRRNVLIRFVRFGKLELHLDVGGSKFCFPLFEFCQKWLWCFGRLYPSSSDVFWIHVNRIVHQQGQSGVPWWHWPW